MLYIQKGIKIKQLTADNHSPSLCEHIVVWSSFCYENVEALLLLLPKFACAVCTHDFPILPSNAVSLVCKIRSSLATVDLCLQNHKSASITGRTESSPSLHGSSLSSLSLLLPQEVSCSAASWTCLLGVWIKSEKISSYSILVQERTSELHSPL